MSKKNVSGQIFEFDPVIYPLHLWVAIKPQDKIYDVFRMLDEDYNETTERVKIQPNNVARTIAVAHRESDIMGCLVYINLPKLFGAGYISHESSHVVDWFCDYLGIGGFSFMDGEARAYLIQWVADCIEKVLKHKV